MSTAELTTTEDGPRSKRPGILHAAVTRFGEVGYEATKWSEIADTVGIGQTALYHYFESKAHCLFTIMRLGLSRAEGRFTAALAAGSTPAEQFRTAVRGAYATTDSEALQSRILQANIALLAAPRASKREEAERLACRALVREIEHNWEELLARGMDTGEFPRRDPRLLARLVLGTIVSVWRWHRPEGSTDLDVVAEFVEQACTRMVQGR
jgi:AcrR family transcriptional regulator